MDSEHYKNSAYDALDGEFLQNTRMTSNFWEYYGYQGPPLPPQPPPPPDFVPPLPPMPPPVLLVPTEIGDIRPPPPPYPSLQLSQSFQELNHEPLAPYPPLPPPAPLLRLPSPPKTPPPPSLEVPLSYENEVYRMEKLLENREQSISDEAIQQLFRTANMFKPNTERLNKNMISKYLAHLRECVRKCEFLKLSTICEGFHHLRLFGRFKELEGLFLIFKDKMVKFTAQGCSLSLQQYAKVRDIITFFFNFIISFQIVDYFRVPRIIEDKSHIDKCFADHQLLC